MATFKLNQLGVDFKGKFRNKTDNTAFDLTTLSTAICKFIRPDGYSFTKTGAVDGTATNGRVIYTNENPETSVFDQEGTWVYRFELTMTDSDFIPGDFKQFKVKK